MVPLSAFDILDLYRYRVDITLERPLVMPAHRRSVLWRGAFGAVFRSLVCHDLALDCAACPLRAACPFPRVFAPSIPEGRLQIARLRDPPRPFVLSDPHPESPSLSAGVAHSLGLTVVGAAVMDLPYFVVSMKRLGADGIGVPRVRFRVEAVHCLDAADMLGPVVFERGSDEVRPTRLRLRARDLVRPGDATARVVRVRFLTPTDVRGASDAASEQAASPAPPFGVLLRRARDRASALATFFGGGPFSNEIRAVGERADSVLLARSEVRRSELIRKSARTGQRHSVGGVLGAAIYEGEAVGELMPWLRLAELVGVGKHATFGNGRIAAAVLG